MDERFCSEKREGAEVPGDMAKRLKMSYEETPAGTSALMWPSGRPRRGVTLSDLEVIQVEGEEVVIPEDLHGQCNSGDTPVWTHSGMMYVSAGHDVNQGYTVEVTTEPEKPAQVIVKEEVVIPEREDVTMLAGDPGPEDFCIVDEDVFNLLTSSCGDPGEYQLSATTVNLSDLDQDSYFLIQQEEDDGHEVPDDPDLISDPNWEPPGRAGTSRRNTTTSNNNKVRNLNPEQLSEVERLAKVLFSKRTRTLYHWLYPNIPRHRFKAFVEQLWQKLDPKDRQLYINQVLGRFGEGMAEPTRLMTNPYLTLGMESPPNNNLLKTIRKYQRREPSSSSSSSGMVRQRTREDLMEEKEAAEAVKDLLVSEGWLNCSGGPDSSAEDQAGLRVVALIHEQQKACFGGQ